MSPSFRCRCCGAQTLDEEPRGSYEICRNCGWEDDEVQSSDPDYAGGANRGSMNDDRRRLITDAAQRELWRAQQHGSPTIRIELTEGGDEPSLDAAARWMSDAVAGGAQVHIDATCDDPPVVIVRLGRSDP